MADLPQDLLPRVAKFLDALDLARNAVTQPVCCMHGGNKGEREVVHAGLPRCRAPVEMLPAWWISPLRAIITSQMAPRSMRSSMQAGWSALGPLDTLSSQAK